MKPELDGWSITHADDAEWFPWGQTGDARAKILGNADGYLLTIVEAEAGYRGTPHEHEHAEFLYLISGSLRTQGQRMAAGDGYAAAAGSSHDDFETETATRYVIAFRV
jgi:uncharacterized protein